MTSSADKYVKNVVNDTGDEEEIVDSDGEVLGKNLWIRGLIILLCQRNSQYIEGQLR